MIGRIMEIEKLPDDRFHKFNIKQRGWKLKY